MSGIKNRGSKIIQDKRTQLNAKIQMQEVIDLSNEIPIVDDCGCGGTPSQEYFRAEELYLETTRRMMNKNRNKK